MQQLTWITARRIANLRLSALGGIGCISGDPIIFGTSQCGGIDWRHRVKDPGLSTANDEPLLLRTGLLQSGARESLLQVAGQLLSTPHDVGLGYLCVRSYF